jgi:ferrous iron transport protein B
MGKLFRVTLFRGETAPFVMELPPYRVPTLKSLLIHMWDRSKIFLRKMGGVILVGSILIWFLGAFPRHPELPPSHAGDIQPMSSIQTKGEGLESSAHMAETQQVKAEPKNEGQEEALARLSQS